MGKLAVCICENEGTDSAFVFVAYTVQLLLFGNFKPLAIFCSCRVRFVSELTGIPKTTFFHDEALLVSILTDLIFIGSHGTHSFKETSGAWIV